MFGIAPEVSAEFKGSFIGLLRWGLYVRPPTFPSAGNIEGLQPGEYLLMKRAPCGRAVRLCAMERCEIPFSGRQRQM